MTNEDLDELRRVADARSVIDFLSDARLPALQSGVRKLLDEREMLLEAAKAIVADADERVSGQAPRRPFYELLLALGAAIGKAEAP